MLAANRAVGEHLQKSGRPAVYRVHEPPAGDKLQRFTDFMQHLGVRVDREELQRVKGWQRILDSFAGTEKRLVLEEVILRSMMKARYEVSNDGHFGLAFDSYTHFTSPIRRYPDLLVHRILKLLARGESYSLAEVRKAARISSQQELVAQEAEREAVKIKQLLYLEQRVGDVFRGVIRGVERFGLFVELSEVLVDGLIPAQQMDDDFYDYDEKSWTFRGRRTGTVYQLGQVLQVQITRCDVQERLLDLRVMREDEESDSGNGTDLPGENEKSRGRPRSKQSGRRKNGKGKGYNGSPRRRGKKKKP
jgi:ribonuclease R